MSSPEEPPYYILVSQTSTLNNPSGPASTSLSHPIIEYHYADDSPHALLPQYPGEHILVIDYDPARFQTPAVKSLSADLAVTGLRITDAPGAGVADDEPFRNDKMYILETTTMPEENMDEDDGVSPHAILARFRQRNTVLRCALEYTASGSNENQPAASSPSQPPPE